MRLSPRTSRSIRGLWVAAALVVALLPNVALADHLSPGGTFTDEDGNIHEPNIEAISLEGITKGCNPPANDRYCPSDPVTRGEMAAFLVRAFELPPSATDAFADDGASVFQTDVNALAEAGITKGCSASAFCPDQPVTRGQMAAFLVRAIPLTADDGTDAFTDDEGSVFQADIEKLAYAGVTKGCGDTVFCPDDLVLRDQMASFLARALDLPEHEVPAPTTPDGVYIAAGEQAQAVVDSQPAGTTFVLGAGVHPLAHIVPRSGDVFVGETGAVLSGAAIVTGFVASGDNWVLDGQTAEGDLDGECEDGYDACIYPEQLFWDGDALWQVSSLDQVGAGEWFFDYAADKVYIADNPTGHTVELGITRNAFDGEAADVTISDVVIEKYANPAQTGAVHPRDGANGTFGTGWVIDRVEVRYNHGEGVKLGPGMQVIDSYLHHNGRLGIHGSSTQLTGVVVAGNEISSNCVVGFLCMGWGGGGVKIAEATGVVVIGNYIHDNIGMGIHADVDSIDSVFEDNLVVDNVGPGIVVEVSYGAVISGNTVEGNGLGDPAGPGILTINSADVEIYDNTVTNNGQGIVGRQVVRDPGPFGERVLDNLYVHDNTITMTLGWTGIRQEVGDLTLFTNHNNRFQSNTYYLGTRTEYYQWEDELQTTTEWVAFGQDTLGIWP